MIFYIFYKYRDCRHLKVGQLIKNNFINYKNLTDVTKCNNRSKKYILMHLSDKLVI